MCRCGVMKTGCLGGRLGWSFATGGFAGSGVVVVTISFSVVVVVTSSGVVNFSPSSSAVFSHSSLVTENDEDTTV